MNNNIEYQRTTAGIVSSDRQLKRIAKLFCLLILLFSFSSCKKLAEVGPPNTFLSENVYNSNGTAISVLTGFYANMSNGNVFTGSASLSFRLGLLADEWQLFSGISGGDSRYLYYSNNLFADQAAGTEYWDPTYNFIFQCNTAIEGLSAATSLTPAIKDQLLGEAKFLRAFYYFYLVNLYGDVPLSITSDYKVNALLSRASKEQVYQQIVADLRDAQDLLSDQYLDGTLLKTSSERIRPNKWAATALLARTYLYLNDWANAESQATAVINQSSVYQLSNLDNAFLKASLGNKEAIWQLQPVKAGWNTEDARVFILTSFGPNDSQNPVYLGSQLLSGFEAGDQRRYNRHWIDSVIVGGTRYYFPFKYKSAKNGDPVNEYLMVLRLGEQYLIRAEARAHLNTNISGAQSDINALRTRSGLSNTIATDKPSLLTAILHERQVELFSEWGHRWLDLKRTGTVNTVMTVATTQKASGATWRSYQQYFPISLTELQRGVNLRQTSGY